jgi:acyl-CoA synthetase (AMP-forming)/AMP-acid ligase II
LIELLRRADPSATAVVTADGVASYGELVERAHLLAAGLASRGVRRFGVLSAPASAAEVVALLAAASLTGAEACAYPPNDDPAASADLARRFGHDLVVTGRTLPGVATMSADEIASGAGRGVIDLEPPAHRPLLLLTTGTTGAPRGVRHDWARLLRALRHVRPGTDERWLLAYGLNQFAGVQVLLHVTAAGAALIDPAGPQPPDGLAAARRHGADHISATPTYWRFLLAELHTGGGPVPALRQVTLGGEAVPTPLLDQLRAVFPHARISQVYAASEFGAAGSVRDGRHGLALDILARGEDADVAVKIVDGQLWVRSRVGMVGYYDASGADPDGWRPTGDLVEIVDDRIVFCGRAGDIINVGGVKVHPLPIEERVSAVDGVEIARVYGRPNALTGAIVAVDVVPMPGADSGTVKAAVRAACLDLPPAARPRSVRIVREVALAGSKIARREAS